MAKRTSTSRTTDHVGHLMTIGEVAERYGLTLRALRFYEDKGLIEVTRSGTTRYYAPDQIARLERVLHWKKQGFGLFEIKQKIRAWNPNAKGFSPEELALHIVHLEKQRDDINEQIVSIKNEHPHVFKLH